MAEKVARDSRRKSFMASGGRGGFKSGGLMTLVDDSYT